MAGVVVLRLMSLPEPTDYIIYTSYNTSKQYLFSRGLVLCSTACCRGVALHAALQDDGGGVTSS